MPAQSYSRPCIFTQTAKLNTTQVQYPLAPMPWNISKIRITYIQFTRKTSSLLHTDTHMQSRHTDSEADERARAHTHTHTHTLTQHTHTHTHAHNTLLHNMHTAL